MTVILETMVKIVAGDLWEQEIIFTDASTGAPYDLTASYDDFQSQWRTHPSRPDFIEALIDSSQANSGLITIKFLPDDTRKMLGPGVIDIQALPGPNTLVMFNVEVIQDVTR